MRDVQRAVIGPSKDASCEGLVFINFGQHTAGAASGVEDLHAESAGDVVAADFIDSHAVTKRVCDIRRSFVEFEVTIAVDRQPHGHRRHFSVEHTFGVYSESPCVSPAVVGNGQSSTVVR